MLLRFIFSHFSATERICWCGLDGVTHACRKLTLNIHVDFPLFQRIALPVIPVRPAFVVRGGYGIYVGPNTVSL